jgi:hypothetical protein
MGAARSRAAAHPRRDEDHVGAFDRLFYRDVGLLGRRLADVRIASRTKPSCRYLAKLNARLRRGRFKRLPVGVHSYKIDPAQAGFHHAVDRIRTTAADADHFNIRTMGTPTAIR